jgi:uncharacterized cupredoxin-like copper-binding protein
VKRFLGLSVLILGTALGLLLRTYHASASGPTRVNVTLKDYQVILSTRHLPVGKPITFVITNRGHHTHEFVLEMANAFDQAIQFDGKTDEADEIKPGATRTVTWTIPRAGSYKFACHIDHHYQKGMRTYATATQDH